MKSITPWKRPRWQEQAKQQIENALEVVGRPVTGPLETVKSWGRANIQRASTADGDVWIKHSFRLPPGEEVVLSELSTRWAESIPSLVASWDGAVAMETLAGTVLKEDAPLDEWVAAVRCLAEMALGEQEHVDAWLELGVRDRRPAQWRGAIESLIAGPTVQSLDADLLKQFEAYVPLFVKQYEDGFQSPATPVHQDSGCCNIQILDNKNAMLFDWADVVIGHPTYSCDRLLDQVPRELHDPVIEAFLSGLGLAREEFAMMRKNNVLHEILRYHDELDYLDEDDHCYVGQANSVKSQIKVLVEHLNRKAT